MVYSRATTSSTAERCFLPEPEVVFFVLGLSLAIAAVWRLMKIYVSGLALGAGEALRNQVSGFEGLTETNEGDEVRWSLRGR